MTSPTSSLFNHTTTNNRPARHIACPQRLKYIHNIHDGYIPYVEDSAYAQPLVDKDTCLGKTARLGLYNAADAWQDELMSLAQQVQSSLKTTDEPVRTRSSRSHLLNPFRPNVRSITNTHSEERPVNKRLLNRSIFTQIKSDVSSERTIVDSSSITVDHQDHGIWLLPILCHILHIDTITEAQEWLTNANPTEKRLAMELISRTMQDMYQHENDLQSDVTNPELSIKLPNYNKLYWPFKCWQRQYQPQSQWMLDHHSDRCERATSPLRLVTPAKRLSTTAKRFHCTTQSSAQTNHDPLLSSILVQTKQVTPIEKPDVFRLPTTPMIASPSTRHSYRVMTAMTNFDDQNDRSIAAIIRGKTPLV